MSKIDWNKLESRVQAIPAQETETDFNTDKANFMAFASSGAKPAAKVTQAPTQSGLGFEASELGKDLSRAYYSELSTAMAAMGQWEQADEYKRLYEENLGTAPMPGLLEAPSGRAVKQVIVEEGAKWAVRIGSAFIPVVGHGLLAAQLTASVYGESRANIRDETGEDRAAAALVPAAINLGMEALPVMKVLDKLGATKAFRKELKGALADDAKSGVIARSKELAKSAAGIGLAEGLTEVAQNTVNLATVRVLKDETLMANLNVEQQTELWNSFWAGMVAGGSIGAVAEGYNQYTIKDRLKELKDIEKSDEEILNAVGSQPAPTAPEITSEQAQQQAASAIISEAQQTPATSTTLDLQVTPVQDLKNQKQRQLIDEIASMPQAQKDVALLTGQQHLEQVRAEIVQLEQMIGEDNPSGDLMSVLEQEPNYNASQAYTSQEIPLTVPDNFVAILEKDGQLLESTIDKTESGDIALTDGFMPITDDGENVDMETYQFAQESWQLMQELGLDKNPLDGTPMRFIASLSGQGLKDNSAASFMVADKSTYLMRFAPTANKQEFMDNMTHELGHLVATQVLANASQGQRSRLYNTWTSDLKNSSTRGDYYAKFSPTYQNAKDSDKKIRNFDQQKLGNTSYRTSLGEYLAEQFSLAFFNTKDGFRSDPMYKQMREQYKQLYQKMKPLSDSVGITRPVFRDFVRLASLRQQEREMAAKAKQVSKDVSAAKAASKEVPVAESVEKKNIGIRQPNTYDFDPTSDAAKVIRLIEKMQLYKQADNVAQVVDLNMGFLGDNIRGRAARKMMSPLQIAEQANNKGFSHPTRYMEMVQDFQATKMKLLEKADRIMRDWTKFGKDGTTRISRMLYLVSTKSDELKRRLTPDELQSIASQVKLKADEQAQWAALDASMQEVVDDLESAMLYDTAKTYIEDKALAKEFRNAYIQATDKRTREKLIEQYTGKPLLNLSQSTVDPLTNPLWDAVEAVRMQMDAMRNRNYYPRSRMGEYAVRVSGKKGTTWEDAVASRENETLGFYAFDTKAEQDSFLASIKDDMGDGLKAYAYKMDSEVFATMGLPAGIIEQIKRELPNLTQNQREQLDDIAMQRSPGRKFLRHLTRRRGVAGYSEDALRVYANYMTTAANHTARAEHASDIAGSLADMKQAIEQIPGDVVQARDLNVLHQYFVKHFDYLMKPDNDWARLRAIGFMWYLGFNVKSAAVNFMQTPMVTYPVLAKHTSDANAIKRISGAMKDAVTVMRGKSLDADVMNSVQKMIEAGLIDESIASELAGMSEADALKRLVPGMDLKSTFDKFAHYGGAMFRVGEKYNRYVAAIAAHRIARDNKLNDEETITFVRDTIQGSQFEYSRWNRAEFMRGKKSVLFLFWQYMQHATYLLAGGKGSKTASRMFLLALLVAGLEGLPFAELIFNILDASGTQIKKLLGHANPRVALREDLRELVSTITDTPDAILKGSSYFYGLGPLHAASLAGVPIPNVSTRGSLSYGNPVPWFDGILDPTISDDQKMLAQTVAAVAGPVGGIGLGIVDAMTSNDPNAWKRWEKLLPIFARNASQGIRWATEGEELDAALAQQLVFETPEQRAEAVIKSLGFQPTRVDQTRARARAVQVPILYHQARREALLKQLDYAVATKNREGRADVLQAIKDYNVALASEKGYAPLMINSSSIQGSLQGRAQRRAEKNVGIMQGKNNYLLQREVEKLYPVVGENDGSN